MFLFSVVCVPVCICFLCVSHHYQVIEEEHLPLMRSLFLWFIHISDIIESTAAHQPTVRNRQNLRKKERDQITSLHQHRKWKEGCLEEYGWRMKLIFHMEVECFAALSCGIWNYSTKLMSSFSLKSAVFIAHALINSFTHLLTWRGGKIYDQKL